MSKLEDRKDVKLILRRLSSLRNDPTHYRPFGVFLRYRAGRSKVHWREFFAVSVDSQRYRDWLGDTPQGFAGVYSHKISDAELLDDLRYFSAESSKAEKNIVRRNKRNAA